MYGDFTMMVDHMVGESAPSFGGCWNDGGHPGDFQFGQRAGLV